MFTMLIITVAIYSGRTQSKQFTILSRLEALSYFKDSNYLDRRISAYNLESRTVDFIMINMDQSNFKSKQELNKAKARALSKISTTFRIRNKSSKPTTVICSGNGYHFYIPADSQGKILVRMPKFRKLNEPSKEFLRFAESYLSNDKCDSRHNKTVSFNNCMLRIPGSFNSNVKAKQEVIILRLKLLFQIIDAVLALKPFSSSGGCLRKKY